MPDGDLTRCKEEIVLLKRQLKVMRELDSIRDEFEERELREQLLESLKFLARELNATSAFVAYYDAYKQLHELEVDRDGLINHDEFRMVNQLCKLAEEARQLVEAVPRLVSGSYCAVPLIIRSEFIGIVGIGRCETDAGDRDLRITESEKVLLADAATVLDTSIRKRIQEVLRRDEMEIVDALDQINDEAHTELSNCLIKMLSVLTSKLTAKAALIFGPTTHKWVPIAADATGSILWETSQPMQLEIKLCVQQSDGRSDPIVRHYQNDAPGVIMGRHIRSMVVQPLRTKVGETAGTLVILSDKYMSAGHIWLIRRAASQMDTVILGRRRSEVMARRYGKYVGSQALDVLLNAPEWLDPRQETVVILSADLVGSTEYSSMASDPFTVFKHINAYLGLIGSIVKNEFHGTLDKYIGDEVMGVFGAPVPDASHSVHAVECALCILESVAKLNERREKLGEPTFEVKITLGLVKCVVGEVGSPDTQTDYTAIGHDVDCVFRIAPHALPSRIIVNEALRNELASRYDFELRKEVDDAKGVNGRLTVYELKQPASQTAFHGDPGYKTDQAERDT